MLRETRERGIQTKGTRSIGSKIDGNGFSSLLGQMLLDHQVLRRSTLDQVRQEGLLEFFWQRYTLV